MSTSLNTGNPQCPLNPQSHQPLLGNHSLQSQAIRNMATESKELTENMGDIKSGRNIQRAWMRGKAVVTTFLMLKNYPKASNGSTAGWCVSLWSTDSTLCIVHLMCMAYPYAWFVYVFSLNQIQLWNSWGLLEYYGTTVLTLRNYPRLSNGLQQGLMFVRMPPKKHITVTVHGTI